MPDPESARSLAELLRRRIALEGPISIADWMATCLGHPRFGYYMRGDPFGAQGDFVTAPEISQVFGELIGLWCAERWLAMGMPAGIRLVELGPGRGTLMADALRATRQVPNFHAAISLHLVETSPALRAIQARTLRGRPVSWHDDLARVPDGPLLLIANELFDALPIRQFVRTERGWCERLVDQAEGRFRFVVSRQPAPMAALLPSEADHWPEGSVAEISPSGIALATSIAGRIARDGGAAIVIDYGHSEPRQGDTLQAVRRHARHDPLADPGSADITAHVDFSSLAKAVTEAGAAVYGPADQGDFLRALGIEQRIERLAAAADPAQAEALHEACRRLIAPDAMGTLFKAMAIVPAAASPGGDPPPGFASPVPQAGESRGSGES